MRKRIVAGVVALAVLVPGAAAIAAVNGTWHQLTGNEGPFNEKFDCPPGEDVALGVRRTITATDEAQVRYSTWSAGSVTTYSSGDMGANSTDWIIRRTNQNTIWFAAVRPETGSASAIDWGCVSGSYGAGWYRTSASNPLTP